MTCIVQGASRGIGLEFVRQLAGRGENVVATCRTPQTATALQALAQANANVRVLPLDLEDEGSIERAASEVGDAEVSLLINAAGLLHEGDVQPEKKLAHVDPASLQRVFAVNAYGPLLMAKHFASKLPRRERAVFASLSARVGSIGDNRLGGWYAYRASKAAQNMFTKNLAIELGRRHKGLAVIALHPGTVRTDLSAPFRSNVPAQKLFEVERAARQLLTIIDGCTAEQTGQFFAWDGSEIPW